MEDVEDLFPNYVMGDANYKCPHCDFTLDYPFYTEKEFKQIGKDIGDRHFKEKHPEKMISSKSED